MRKASLLMAFVFALTAVARAATSVQYFDTGQISPGDNTVSAFNVNYFDTSLGTLTAVTVAMHLDTWGGSYSIINTTSPDAPVHVSMTQGISAYLTAADVRGLPSAATSAGQTASFTLEHAGSQNGLSGPASYAEHVSAVSSPAPVANANFISDYKGSGTYQIAFHSSQHNTHSADGSVTFTGVSAYSQGFLTVTYEYDAVPEPTSLALLAMGGAALGLRRRPPRAPKA